MKRIAASFVLVVVAVVCVRPADQVDDSPKFVVPDASDLTIKTRQMFDRPNSTVVTEIVYLKGAWQRREQILDFPQGISPNTPRVRYVSVTRCDDRRRLELNDEARTYATLSIPDVAVRVRSSALLTGPRPQFVPPGADVKVTVESVDTGERRRMGRYTARRVITTTTTEPGPGAKARAGRSVQDGWFIDLPPVDCHDWGDHPPILSGSIAPDRVRIEQRRGPSKRGFPIDQLTRIDEGGRRIAERVELLEFSEKSVDPSIFTVPRGYKPALPRLTGGFDMTRPDTLTNRLQSYWEGLTSQLQYLLRRLVMP
jgi:hypothetical protein